MKTLDQTYKLIDSGNGRKLERFGRYVVARPSAQACWQPLLQEGVWKDADAIFTRESENRWINKPQLPSLWTINVAGINFKISPTDFGHLGIFPEQSDFWDWIQATITKAKEAGRKEIKVLNLFAYSGGSTLAAAKAGAHVCHLDASKGMVTWARENAALNQLEERPIRWIVDDVSKFLARELRRENRYDAIILDPPSFGRGNRGEVFKIEEDLPLILSSCRSLLTDNPLFIIFTCHTPGFTPIVMGHLLSQTMDKKFGQVDVGEMILKDDDRVLPVPSGTYARWQCGS
jgi:23S rRNA (cytosine1962-C5)-methyltransferase